MREIDEKAMELRVRLAAQIKFWLLRFNMDVKALAAKSGIPAKQIYRYKSMEQSATTDKISALADGFGIQPEILLLPLAVDNGSDSDE